MPRKQLPEHLRRPPGRPQLYPWDTWLDGDAHVIRPEIDFDCDTESMRQQIYVRARRKGVKVSIRRLHDGFIVQADLQNKPLGADARYDWDRLLNGAVHVLAIGKDVHSKPESFRSYARQVARSRGLSLSCKRTGDLLLLQARPRRGSAEVEVPPAPQPASEPAPPANDFFASLRALEKDPLTNPRPFA